MDTSNKKVVIATHIMVYGAAHALRDYLNKQKVNQLLYIGHPINEASSSSVSELYKQGKRIKKKNFTRNHLSSFNYFIDFFLTLKWVFQERTKFALFIGIDNLNCLAGLILKKLNRVDQVYYYSIDFSPIRFKNKFLNFIYHQIETYCVKKADQTWNTSPRVAQGRQKFLNLSSQDFPPKVVPIGVWNDQIKKRPFSEVKKHQLLFVGHLLEKQGIQKVLEAIPEVIKKIPDFNFLIVGGGEYQLFLKKKVNQLRINDHVQFTGWVKERCRLDNLLSESAAAIAVYKPEKDQLYNFTYYADPTKLKDYLSAGLPIILTNVPHNAKTIKKKGCGLVVPYQTEAIAQAIIKLLSDPQKLKKYRQNALQYVKTFDWSKIFEKALNL